MILNKLSPDNIGQTLKTFIKEYYGTQANFAEIANVDIRTVGRWIKNGVDSIAILTELINIFGNEFYEAL